MKYQTRIATEPVMAAGTMNSVIRYLFCLPGRTSRRMASSMTTNSITGTYMSRKSATF